MIDFERYLKQMVERDGSDLFLSTGAPISCKIHGKLEPIGTELLMPGEVKEYAYNIMDEEQTAAFEKRPEMNLAIQRSGVGRFRVNIFKQRNEIGMVIRTIKTEIPSFESLNLPPILLQLVMQKRGLVLFVGGTGSGKSTSLASLINHRNENSYGHIITVEDPVEFVHQHKKSIVNQREVGGDTLSYKDALENTLRQAPDVILIGEIRSAETMESALAFAETGHLCISTLHANNANQAIDRIVNFFPEERHKQLFLDISLNLRGIVSQRLIPTIDNKRAAAVEVLLGTPRVCDLIKNGEPDLIKEVMDKSENQGMQTFDLALYKLYKQGKISLDEAIKNADSKNNLRLKVTLDSQSENETSPSADHEQGNAQGNTASDKKNKESASTPAQTKPAQAKPITKTIELSLTPIDDEEKDKK